MITDEYAQFLGWAYGAIEMGKKPLWYIGRKIGEEAGELDEALIATYGLQASRKPPGTRTEVVDELADVVCTALLGILRCGANPETVLRRQMDKVRGRFESATQEPSD